MPKYSCVRFMARQAIERMGFYQAEVSITKEGDKSLPNFLEINTERVAQKSEF